MFRQTNPLRPPKIVSIKISLTQYLVSGIHIRYRLCVAHAYISGFWYLGIEVAALKPECSSDTISGIWYLAYISGIYYVLYTHTYQVSGIGCRSGSLKPECSCATNRVAATQVCQGLARVCRISWKSEDYRELNPTTECTSGSKLHAVVQ